MSNLILNIMNESLDIKIRQIKIEDLLEIGMQSETNLDSYCTLILINNRFYIFVVLYRHILNSN